MAFEYVIDRLDMDLGEYLFKWLPVTLKRRGDDGWELVGHNADLTVLIFKRRQ